MAEDLLLINAFTNGRPLCSNLREIKFEGAILGKQTTISVFSIILSPSVNTIAINFNQRPSYDRLNSYLDLIKTKSPNLEELTLIFDESVDGRNVVDNSEHLFEPFSHIRHLHSLRRITVSASLLTVDHVNNLRHLPHLYRLHVYKRPIITLIGDLLEVCQPSTDCIDEKEEKQEFPALNDVLLCGSSEQVASTLEQVFVHPHQLTQLRVIRMDTDITLLRSIKSLLPNLTRLALDCDRTSRETPLIYPGQIELLTSLEYLSELWIAPCDVKIEDLQKMMAAWPNLRILHLSPKATANSIVNTNLYRFPGNSLTLTCLSEIAEKLPKLEHLAICVAASDMTLLPKKPVSFKCLRKLKFITSFTNRHSFGFDVDKAALFISSCCREAEFEWVANHMHRPGDMTDLTYDEFGSSFQNKVELVISARALEREALKDQSLC